MKQQMLVLRELEKKNESEIKSLKSELESWKAKVGAHGLSLSLCPTKFLTMVRVGRRFKW